MIRCGKNGFRQNICYFGDRTLASSDGILLQIWSHPDCSLHSRSVVTDRPRKKFGKGKRFERIATIITLVNATKYLRFSDKQWRIQGMVATHLAKSKSAGRLSVAARSWGCRWSMPLFQRYPAMGSKTVSEPARITRSHNRPRTRILLHEGYSRLVLLFRGVTVPNIIGRLQLPRAHRAHRASLSSSS
jgi:hypothetical protein